MSVIAIMRGVSDKASLFTESDVVFAVDTDTDPGIIA